MKPTKDKPLTNKEKVKVVEHLLSMSGYNEAKKSEEVSLLNTIYRVIHPTSKCRHWEWEQEARELLKEAK